MSFPPADGVWARRPPGEPTLEVASAFCANELRPRLLRDALAEGVRLVRVRAVLGLEVGRVCLLLCPAGAGGVDRRLVLRLGSRLRLLRDATSERVAAVLVGAVELSERLAAVVGGEVRVVLCLLYTS